MTDVGRPTKYNFGTMRAGDCFYVSSQNDAAKVASAACHWTRRHNYEPVFSVKKVATDCYRVTREK